MNKYISSFLVLLTVVCLYGCGQSQKKSGRRVVTVTIEPLRYFTERIAGDKFQVQTMVPAGGNPETYEPTAQQMVDLSQSDLYIKVGSIGFERTWMKRLEANAPHAIVIDSSEGITPAQSAEGVADPHTWMSTTNASVIATNIYRALSNIDNRDSLYFRKNLDALLADIDNVDTQIREQLTRYKSSAFLIYHPILTYFARDYRLTQIPMEQEGREPSAKQLSETIAEARKLGVHTFFVQKEFSNRNVDVVATSVGAKKVSIHPLGYDWDKEMVKIATLLR